MKTVDRNFRPSPTLKRAGHPRWNDPHSGPYEVALPVVGTTPAVPACWWRGKSVRTMLLVFLFLLAGEFGVRLRAYVIHGQTGPEADIYDTDPMLGKIPKAGASMVSHGATTTINRWGLRGHDIALEKTPGTIRVLCLGESTTFGQPSDDDESVWPARLERMLNERYPGASVEVLNGAMPGYTVSQSHASLDRRLARFKPDIVVVCHAATNISSYARRQFHGTRSYSSRRGGFSALRDRYSLAYMLLRANTASILASQFLSTRNDRLDERYATLFANGLTALIDDCEQRGWQVVMCTFPRAFDAEQPAWLQRQLAQSALFFNPRLSISGLINAYERHNNAIRRVAKEHSLLLADLDRVVPRGKTHFIDSVHLSQKGHEAVAHHVADSIIGLIDDL